MHLLPIYETNCFPCSISCGLFSLVQVAYWLRNASCVVTLCIATKRSKNFVLFFIIFSLLSLNGVLLNCLLNT